MKRQLNLPDFKNVDEELEFWSSTTLSEYYEPSDAQPISFPNLKPSTRSISLRLPENLIDRIKERANEMDIPYQSLIKSSLTSMFSR